MFNLLGFKYEVFHYVDKSWERTIQVCDYKYVTISSVLCDHATFPHTIQEYKRKGVLYYAITQLGDCVTMLEVWIINGKEVLYDHTTVSVTI